MDLSGGGMISPFNLLPFLIQSYLTSSLSALAFLNSISIASESDFFKWLLRLSRIFKSLYELKNILSVHQGYIAP